MKFQVKELLGKISRIFPQEEKGQTLIEYALIVLLISIVVIVVLGALGGDVTDVFTSFRTTFSGATPTT